MTRHFNTNLEANYDAEVRLTNHKPLASEQIVPVSRERLILINLTPSIMIAVYEVYKHAFITSPVFVFTENYPPPNT